MIRTLLAVMAVSLVLLVTGAGGALAQTTNWRIVGLSRPTPQWELWEWFGSEVEKRSNGAISVTLVSLPELGLTGFELVRVIKAGLVDVADILPTYVAGDVPMLEGADLPALYPDFPTAARAHEAFMPVLNRHQDQLGGVVLGLYHWPRQILWSRKPVRSLDDLKGMRIRVYGTALAEMFSSLGAAPVSIAFAEVYTALERGAVDGGIAATYSGYALKWYEVTKYHIEMNLGPVIGTLVVGRRTWDALTPERQQMLTQLGAEFTQRAREVTRRTTQEGIEKSRERGVEYIDNGAEFQAGVRRAVISAVIPGWTKRAGPDSKALFNEYLAPYAGYRIP